VGLDPTVREDDPATTRKASDIRKSQEIQMKDEALKLAFEHWWDHVGSMAPERKADMYEHCKKQCALAWEAALAAPVQECVTGLDVYLDPADMKPKRYPAAQQEPVAWVEYETGNHTKRPQNCGTGYCSCIECVMPPAPVQEPDAIGRKCAECGEWQRWTPSGMVCKNGHGGASSINQ
jgi:hypothetical protein